MRIAIALTAALLLFAGCSDNDSGSGAAIVTTDPIDERSLLFALQGHAAFSNGELTLETPYIDWFTDHPQRHAGRMTLADFVADWGRWGFSDNPPNAGILGDELDAIIVLEDGSLDEARLRFAVTDVLEGELPEGDIGNVALFIDSTSDCARAQQGGSRLDLVGASLSGCDLSGVDLTESHFDQASASGANLNGAELKYSWWHQVNAYTATFVGADLSHARLGSDFYGVDFSGADLSFANATAAGFDGGTNFTGANFDSANFYLSEGLEDANLTDVTWGPNITCPDGTISVYHDDSCEGAFGDPDFNTTPTIIDIHFTLEDLKDPNDTGPAVSVWASCPSSTTSTSAADDNGDIALDVSTCAKQGAHEVTVHWTTPGYDQGQVTVEIQRHQTTTESIAVECPTTFLSIRCDSVLSIG